MTTDQMPHGYFAAGQAPQVERHRLDLLEQRYDHVSFGRLSGLLPLAGRRCLEVGAGGGSVARWLAEQVGRGGRVLATDIDTRFLVGLPPTVQVLAHDIMRDPLPVSAFDVVHCRALLMHVASPAVALARMVDALRPGGRLVVENVDYSTLRAATSDHSAAVTWNDAARTVLDAVARLGLFAPDLGARLGELVAAAGLVTVETHRYEQVHHGGDPVAELLARSFVYLTPHLTLVQEHLAVFCAGLADPGFEFVDAVNVGVTARRPEESTDADRR